MFWWCCTRSEPTPAASLWFRYCAHRRVPWTCLASGRAHPPSRRHRPWLGRSHVLERAWPRHPLPRHLGTAPQPQHLGTAPQPPLEPRNLDLESSNVGLVRLAGAGQLLLSGGNCLVRGPTRRRHADTTLLIRQIPPNRPQPPLEPRDSPPTNTSCPITRTAARPRGFRDGLRMGVCGSHVDRLLLHG